MCSCSLCVLIQDCSPTADDLSRLCSFMYCDVGECGGVGGDVGECGGEGGEGGE